MAGETVAVALVGAVVGTVLANLAAPRLLVWLERRDKRLGRW